jgi:creatinine amidohydrolase/Fe(II)-dependent formamide hydrolase-like protein
MPPVTGTGVVGAPSTASAERGEELFGMLVDALEDLLVAARAERDADDGYDDEDERDERAALPHAGAVNGHGDDAQHAREHPRSKKRKRKRR